MSIKVLITTFFIYNIGFLYAQESKNFNVLFFEILENKETPLVEEDPDIKTTWIESAEIRTETDEFDFERQRYAIRFSPSSKKYQQSIKSLLDAQKQKFGFQENKLSRYKINAAYDALISAYTMSQSITLKDSLLNVLYDLEKVYYHEIQEKATNIDDWLEIKSDIKEVQQEILQHENNLSALSPSPVDISWNRLVTVADVKSKITSTLSNASINSVQEELQIDQEILLKELELEKIESKQIIDFIQFDYRGPHDDLLKERFSVTAAFQLPFANNNSRLKQAELKLNQRELLSEYNSNQLDIKNEQREDFLDLQNDIAIYEFQDSRIKNLSEEIHAIEEELKTNPTMRNIGMILNLNIFLIQLKIDLYDLKASILDDYWKYLATTESLYAVPTVNHLMK